MASERVEARINTLLTAIRKAEMQLANNHPKPARVTERVKAYKQSVENLTKFGTETPPTGNPVGAGVDVPAGGNG